MCVGLALPMFAQEKTQLKEHLKSRIEHKLEQYKQPVYGEHRIIPDNAVIESIVMEMPPINVEQATNQSIMKAKWITKGGPLSILAKMITIDTLFVGRDTSEILPVARDVSERLPFMIEEFAQSEEVLPVQKAALYAFTEVLLNTLDQYNSDNEKDEDREAYIQTKKDRLNALKESLEEYKEVAPEEKEVFSQALGVCFLEMDDVLRGIMFSIPDWKKIH